MLFIGVFFKAVVRFNELAEGGTLWFQNLTAIDPVMCLPLILCLSNLLIIEVKLSIKLPTINNHDMFIVLTKSCLI